MFFFFIRHFCRITYFVFVLNLNSGPGRAAFVRYWRLMAEAVRGHPSAVAAEFMNEPMTIWRPDAFDTYREAGQAVNAVIPDMSVSICDIAEGVVIPDWVIHIAGGSELINADTLHWIKTAGTVFYAWHWYAPCKEPIILLYSIELILSSVVLGVSVSCDLCVSVSCDLCVSLYVSVSCKLGTGYLVIPLTLCATPPRSGLRGASLLLPRSSSVVTYGMRWSRPMCRISIGITQTIATRGRRLATVPSLLKRLVPAFWAGRMATRISSASASNLNVSSVVHSPNAFSSCVSAFYLEHA